MLGKSHTYAFEIWTPASGGFTWDRNSVADAGGEGVAGENHQIVGAHRGDGVLDCQGGSVADFHHRDDGGHADDDAESSEGGAHDISAQSAQGGSKGAISSQHAIFPPIT